MGKRGPAPKPTALRLLHGDEKRTINADEPQPAPGLPTRPDGLDAVSGAVWDYIVPELDAMGLAKRPDRDQLFTYVEAVRTHAQATALVHAAGVLIKDRENQPRMNPAIRAQTAAARTILLFAREFGLTPASRVQFHVEQLAQDHAERLLS